MIVLVTGGRDFNNKQMVHDVLYHLFSKFGIDALHHGAARGLDTLCGEWCDEWLVPCYAHPADWDKYGKGAGHIRNQSMLAADPRPDYGVVFPGGRGTADMHQRMLKAGLTVWVPYS